MGYPAHGADRDESVSVAQLLARHQRPARVEFDRPTRVEFDPIVAASVRLPGSRSERARHRARSGAAQAAAVTGGSAVMFGALILGSTVSGPAPDDPARPVPISGPDHIGGPVIELTEVASPTLRPLPAPTTAVPPMGVPASRATESEAEPSAGQNDSDGAADSNGDSSGAADSGGNSGGGNSGENGGGGDSGGENGGGDSGGKGGDGDDGGGDDGGVINSVLEGVGRVLEPVLDPLLP